MAFDSRVTFRPLKETPSDQTSVHGHLLIPIVNGDPRGLPGWIVDGQQRAAAIRDANVNRFPVFVTAFITDSVSEQREGRKSIFRLEGLGAVQSWPKSSFHF